MKIPGKVVLLLPSAEEDAGEDEVVEERKGSESGDSKDSICRPKWLRWTRTDMPPIRACPPFLVAFASWERRIRPAQVPHVGFFWTLVVVSILLRETWTIVRRSY